MSTYRAFPRRTLIESGHLRNSMCARSLLERLRTRLRARVHCRSRYSDRERRQLSPATDFFGNWSAWSGYRHRTLRLFGGGRDNSLWTKGSRRDSARANSFFSRARSSFSLYSRCLINRIHTAGLLRQLHRGRSHFDFNTMGSALVPTDDEAARRVMSAQKLERVDSRPEALAFVFDIRSH